MSRNTKNSYSGCAVNTHPALMYQDTLAITDGTPEILSDSRVLGTYYIFCLNVVWRKDWHGNFCYRNYRIAYCDSMYRV